MSSEYDVFISHASEDKQTFVDPLAKTLREYGLEVWYDKFSIKLGDSLSRSIDVGLANSRFGVLVVSKNFLGKPWPEHELSGLVTRYISGKAVLIPIWLDISKEEVTEYSPSLADKLSLVAGERDIRSVAFEIIERVRPDIFEKIRRRFVFNNLDFEYSEVPLKEISIGPVRHGEFPRELQIRIKNTWLFFGGYLGLSLEEWTESFQRDAHPIRELFFWETVYFPLAAYSLEYPKSYKKFGTEIFRYVYSIFSDGESNLNIDITKKQKYSIMEYIKIARAELQFSVEDNESEDWLDKEIFPKDLPS